MADRLISLPEADVPLFERLLRDYRALGNLQPLGAPAPGGKRQTGDRPPLLAIALEPMGTGETKRVLVMGPSRRPVQFVTINGEPEGGSFRVHYGTEVDADGPDASGSIPWDATAAEFRSALLAIESFGRNDVRVSGGEVTVPDQLTANLGRWFVEFAGIDDPSALTPFQTAEDSLTGSPVGLDAESEYFATVTNTVERVRMGIPVGDPSPVTVGSILTAKWHPGFGYVVDAVECRDFEIPEDQDSS